VSESDVNFMTCFKHY